MQAIAVEVTPETMENAADAAMLAKIRKEIEEIFPVPQSDVRRWFDEMEKVRGPEYRFDDHRCEYMTYRLNYFADAERRVSEFMSTVYTYSEESRIPEGFDFETDTPGLFVHYEPLQEWPGVPKIDSQKSVEVSTFEKIFSDGTIERIVSIESGPTELTYESVHLLIDFLQEAARSLVAAEDKGWQ